MTISHHNFGSIGHFKTFLHEVKAFVKNTPGHKPEEFKLRGTVKLHGTHADYVSEKCEGGSWTSWCQSRNRVLSLESDNNGYTKFMDNIPLDKRRQIVSSVEEVYVGKGKMNGPVETIMIAGEFCGGKIQSNVALNKLQNMFVIFGVKINGVTQHFPDYYNIKMEDENIYNISRSSIYSVVLKLNEPEKVVPVLRDITEAVENECPFAKTFGVSGTGEGVVWVAENMPCTSRYTFKVKGEKHAVSRVRTLGKQTEAELTALKDARTFAQNAVLEPRLRQGLDYLKEMNLESTMKNIGKYLKWVVEDVEKEEKIPMEELGLDSKLVRRGVYHIAKVFYTDHMTSTITMKPLEFEPPLLKKRIKPIPKELEEALLYRGWN